MNYKIAVVCFALAFTGACTSNHPKDITGISTHDAAKPKYQFAIVSANELKNVVRVPGHLKPFEEVNIYAKVNGFVWQVCVDRGSIVHKGQVLARMEAPEMGAQVQTATSKYQQMQEAAVASKERYRRLMEAAKEPGAVAQLELDNAQARMKADEAAVNSEKASLSSFTSINQYLTITAPFDGIIVQRNVSPGALVGNGRAGDQPMFLLQSSNKLRLEAMIPEAYVDNLDTSRQVTFSLNAMPGITYSGFVSRVANSLSGLRSEAVEIDVNNTNGTLKPGMYAEVRVPLVSPVKSAVVPSSAIVHSTERMYVIQVSNKIAHLVDVKEGMAAKDSTIIFGDVTEGSSVLLHATDDISEGAYIE